MFKLEIKKSRKASSDRAQRSKIVIVEYIRTPTEVEGIAIVNITITSPFVLHNVTPYKLSYEFPILRSGGGELAPNSSKSFYFDTGTMGEK